MASPALKVNKLDAQLIDIDAIVRGDNPRRKKPTQEYVQQLADSMGKFGMLEPMLVRAQLGIATGKFQIVAGETRYDAALIAGLTRVPCVVMDLSDDDVLEVQLIENIQRNAMHPVDEGEAFKRLIDRKKHTAETLAKTIGKSVRWVYNRLEFTKLIPSLKKAFIDDELTASHAELLARLEPADQKRADNGANDETALWRFDYLELADPSVKTPPKDKRSVVSIRDLNEWIEHNVRLAIQTTAVQRLIPEIDDVQVEAQATHAKVLQITTAFMLPQSPELKGRFDGVLTERHWKPAGGRSACDYVEKGVIVFGEGQGKVLDVCINKKQCAKHWPEHQPKAVEKRKKDRAKQTTSQATAAASRDREREQEAAKEARWKKLYPALKDALIAALPKSPSAVQLRAALKHFELPERTTPNDLPRVLLSVALHNDINQLGHWHGYEKSLVSWAPLLGVDVKAVEKKVLTPEKPKQGITDPKDLKAVKRAADKHARKVAKRRAGKKR